MDHAIRNGPSHDTLVRQRRFSRRSLQRGTFSLIQLILRVLDSDPAFRERYLRHAERTMNHVLTPQWLATWQRQAGGAVNPARAERLTTFFRERPAALSRFIAQDFGLPPPRVARVRVQGEGGTGGVSIAALQFANAAGARVIATSSSDDKGARAKALGASDVVNYRLTPDWEQEVRKLTSGRGVDCVIEIGGAGTLARSIRSLARGGKVALIGFLAGREGDTNLTPLMMVGGSLHGIFVGDREMFEEMNRAIAVNQIKPVIDRMFPFDSAPAAYQHQASGPPRAVWSHFWVTMRYSGSPVLHEGHVYLTCGGKHQCVELATGKVRWLENEVNSTITSPILADGKLMVFENNGSHLRIVKADPTAYTTVARPKVEGLGCSSPALSNGRLIVRQKDKLVCFDLRPEQ